MSYQSERAFKLVIYESEYRQIQAWTDKYHNLETGGDLFGLWEDDRTAVVQLVVGPGKQCRRTSTSFYQDVDYLKQMGDVLTSEEGLCHIGEWHSHHTLSLSRPSGGDETTVWSNMDRYGLSRFFLFIANISTAWKWSAFNWMPDETTVNGFLFEVDRRNQRHLPLVEAEFIFLQQESPFRLKNVNVIQVGAESLNSAQDQLSTVERRCRHMESELKKVLREKQQLETCLAEANKELQSTVQQSNKFRTSLSTVIQARDQLESSLAREKNSHEETKRCLWKSEQRSNAEMQAREETERRLDSSKQRSHQLEMYLDAQKQAREETERRLHSSEQRSHQLEMYLDAQRQAREETERRLHSSEQRSHQLETSLAAERQAREETERRLHSREQRSHHLETSLAEQRQAREETGRRLRSSEQRSHQLETPLAAQRQAREETEKRLHSSEQRSHELETSLGAQRQAREETERRLKSSEERSHQLETTLAAERQSREETERRLHSSEHRSHQLETTLAAERQARDETERRLHSITQRLYKLETSSITAERQAREETEKRLHNSEQRSYELETSLGAEREERKALKAYLVKEQKAHEETKRNASCDWSLGRNEIILSSTTIREEKWGRVVEGSFFDCKVAVKLVHSHILPSRDRSFFEREMKIAFECRHPCLLEFIGATNDDQIPLFVSELPSTSLRAVLQERALEPSEITTIALDVAKGLNYLHHKHPDAVVHGDISSANVLLWKKGDSGWQAKVSDFYTINFLQQSDSVYTAPEAHTHKSLKVDVYSFGVLFWEMNTGALPDIEHIHQQIARVPNKYEWLIKQCLRENPDNRPSMAEIIETIETIQHY